MGSLLQTMANGNSYKNIHVKEIRINPLNFYSRMEEEGFYVDSMATILAEKTATFCTGSSKNICMIRIYRLFL